MNTTQITVRSNGDGVREAVQATEKLGLEAGLNKKEVLRLQLLAEELLGMMQNIAGEVEADYKVEQEDKSYRIILDSRIDMTKEMRKTLLSVSSTGENEAAKGFMGKLKDMITAALLPSESGPSALSMGLMTMGSPSTYTSSENLNWSMAEYVNSVKSSKGEDAEAAWDELEKSITASIADDIRIRIKGSHVVITMMKTF